MSSKMRCSPETAASPHRYSVFLLWGALVLVSSFSPDLVPFRSAKLNHRNTIPSVHLISNSDTQQQKGRYRSHMILMSSQVTAAGDNQEVRDLFSKYCDKDSLIDRKTLESMPPFADMLAEEDLLETELDEIWGAVTKSFDDSSRVDVASFVQIYRDVDDLFEDDDEEEESKDGDSDDNSNEDISTQIPTADVDNANKLDEELSKAFKSICDKSGFVSKDKMKQWEEISSLFDEGLLDEDEFEELWKNSVKSESGSLDDIGFLKFNSELDDLFDLDDDEDEEDNSIEEGEPEELPATVAPPRAMVIEGDMPPGVLFSQLADQNYLVGMNELNLWTELKDLIDEGELSRSELQEMFDKFATAESSGKLSEAGFLQLYDEIENLFEEVDEDEDNAEQVTSPPQQQKPPLNRRVKQDLLAFIDIVLEDNEEPCGFAASESDQEQILNILQVLEQQPTNMVLQKEGDIERFDLAGNWELLYTSSSAVKYNKGVSGVAGSFPNGKFGGVRQELKATKLLSDVEYKERIELNPSSASFDVTVNGIWDLRKSVSLFTGMPTVILNVEPDRVSYGPTSTRADHWKSLGPLNKLDVAYLDDDLRVMRGCTSSESIFVFKKVNS